MEFTYLKVADITMNNELVDNQRQVGVLYGFDTVSYTHLDVYKRQDRRGYPQRSWFRA